VVTAGDKLHDGWSLGNFENHAYHLRVYAPNGFYREFKGDGQHPLISVSCSYEQRTGNPGSFTGKLLIHLRNQGQIAQHVSIQDVSYQRKTITRSLGVGAEETVVIDLQSSNQWYDVVIQAEGNSTWSERFAGHIETQQVSSTDPLMGGLV